MNFTPEELQHLITAMGWWKSEWFSKPPAFEAFHDALVDKLNAELKEKEKP